MPKPGPKKPFNLLERSILGALGGACLGIITVLIVTAISLARAERHSDWEVTKWLLSITLTIYGFGGAILGGLAGFFIGIIRWAKARERQGES